ncbi:serine hydrolase [Cellulophaga sp. Hel_I_12]|uniref:serine hydrolase domain-containing protein n=1 Tax=Cellulophaga sp. Hel_I_12 TaxID=1249972 RepID=UPI0006491601|nr:serine hydrolase domain-containing protein [Cellulophaga sp. Hel_I_12]
MKTIKITFSLFFVLLYFSCSKNGETNPDSNSKSLYFPPNTSTIWETVSMEELEWNTSAEQDLYEFLSENDSKAFIVLKDGKIAVEWYAADHGADLPWYWASAGKTLTSFTTGIAMEEGFLSLSDKSSEYLGTGWTSLAIEKEDLITVWHQLTMTSGMDDTQGDCKTPNCLTYVADAGTRWSYHNAPYTLIQDVIANATSMDFNSYFTSALKDKIGMTGQWLSSNGQNNVYWSTARSMARFGLLNLNKGIWNEEVILGDTNYLEGMKNTSQNLNKSYGYLWWLNGKESKILPTLQTVFQGDLISEAPEDLYAGLGKNDQKLYIVPSQNIVVVRMGEATGEPTLGPSSFDNELWIRINNLIK